jgi:GTP cyclohydrolase I
VTAPELADIIVDDVTDSGATRSRYVEAFPAKPFIALYERKPGDPWLVFPWEQETGPEDAVVRLLEFVGEDARREGLRDTPRRVVQALRQMTCGMEVDPEKLLSTVFSDDYDEMVAVKAVPFHSLCEHHMLPFHGHATIAYVPSGKVVGLSKLPRLLQERLTRQIAEAIMDCLKPLGVGVRIEAHHTCMSMRGARSSGQMVTTSLLGVFRDSGVRSEFLSLCVDRARM